MIPVGGGESGRNHTGCFTKPQGGRNSLLTPQVSSLTAGLNSPIRLIGGESFVAARLVASQNEEVATMSLGLKYVFSLLL